MFEVELEWPVCPDGVERVLMPPAFGEVEVRYRARSERRRHTTRRLALRDAVSIRLANIYAPTGKRTAEERAREFLERDGFPFRVSELFGVSEIDAESLEGWATSTARLLASAVSEPLDALAAVDFALQIADSRDDLVRFAAGRSPHRRERMSLDVHLIPKPNGRRPQAILRPRTLRDFVLLEVATVACTKGVGLRSCDFCGVRFLTGPGTDRRSTSRFCRELHRVYFNQKRPGGLPANSGGSGAA